MNQKNFLKLRKQYFSSELREDNCILIRTANQGIIDSTGMETRQRFPRLFVIKKSFEELPTLT